MAYDQNSAYQPPQRPYYGQKQQAPVQQSYHQQHNTGYAQDQTGQIGGQYDSYEQQGQQPYGYGEQQQYQQGHGQGQYDGYDVQNGRQGYQDVYAQRPQDGFAQPQMRPEQRVVQQQPVRSVPREQFNYKYNGDPPRQPTQQSAQTAQYDPRVQPAPVRQDPRNGYPVSGKNDPRMQPPMQQPPQSVPVRQDPRNGYLPTGKNDPRMHPTMQQSQQPVPVGRDPRNGQFHERQYDPRMQPAVKQPQRSEPAGRSDQRSGNPQEARNRRETYEQQTAAMIAPPRVQEIRQEQRHAASPERAAKQQHVPRSATPMEDWKAKEKAKMRPLVEPDSPEMMPQDTAFPMFPSKKKERLRPDDRSGVQSAMSSRSSEDRARPDTSNGHRDAQPIGRPPYSREPSYSNDMQPPKDQSRPEYGRGGNSNGQVSQSEDHLAPQKRPDPQHQPFSFEPIKPREPAPQQRPAQYGSETAQYESQRLQSPVERIPPQQWPAPEQQAIQNNTSPPQHRYRSPPQAAGPAQAPNGRPQGPPRDVSHGQHPPEPQVTQMPPRQQRDPKSAPLRGVAAVQPIDTSAVRPPRQPAYMDHQPLSPAYVPPRPSTATGRRPSDDRAFAPSDAFSPTSVYSPQSGERSAAPKQWGAQPLQQHSQHESLGDVYDGYYGDATPAPAPAIVSREAEIEAEMPDFDSAAPGQTSLVHKRGQTTEQHASAAPISIPPGMPGLPTQHANQSVQSLPPSKTRFYQQQQTQQGSSQPEIRQPKKQHGGITDGFVFGVPEDQPQHATYEGIAQPPQAQQAMAYRQRPPHEQPPPTANGQYPPPRRSMDDARQPQYRQAPPPGQRFGPNGHSTQRPILPAQQRPGFDRNASNMTAMTAQSAWTDPGPRMTPEKRVPSAPPLRQGRQTTPDQYGGGAPLTQQRSAPQIQERHSNPDALPHHPAPVRPGLTDQTSPPPAAKPVPVRNYDGVASVQPTHQVRGSIDDSARPVTHAELDQLRAAISANPANNKVALRLAKSLVEASTLLASENGRLDPKTTAKNREKYILDAHKRIKKLASTGYPEAQFYLADCYGQGSLGLEVDTKEAFNLYQAAAKAGHPQAAYRTAVCCEMGPDEGGGTRRDPKKAVQWYRRAAALGDVAAMYKLGMILLKGLLDERKNVGEAINWLKRAAERADKDNPHALHELGMLYEPGNTDPAVRDKVIPDEKYSRELFQQAAALGYKFSQFRLGQAYEYGSLKLPIDSRQSIGWYSKAAAQGEHQAELALSGWYLTGAEGILEHSDTEAYLWARKAASSEPPLAKAMFAMGYFSETGIGCPANLEEARRWYGRAATYHFPKALERLEELKRGGKGNKPANGRLTRKDQRRDEAECAVM